MADHPATSDEGAKLLFTEAEWDATVPKVVAEMTSYLRPYRTAVYRDRGDYGEGWGSGAYLTLGQRVFILTNAHVAEPRETGERLIHLFEGTEDLRLIVGDHVAKSWPWDLALLPVDDTVWSSVPNGSKAIAVEQIALAHLPVDGEILTFAGFPGSKTKFLFDTLCAESQCSTARECKLPQDDRFNARFHFGIDYRPDRAISVTGGSGLSLPPGLSGSVVWNTAFVQAKMAGLEWSPELAQVTGVLWGWPPDDAGYVVATRAEHLRSFLLGALGVPAIEP